MYNQCSPYYLLIHEYNHIIPMLSLCVYNFSMINWSVYAKFFSLQQPSLLIWIHAGWSSYASFNLTWYQSRYLCLPWTSETSINAPNPLSFHIIPRIIALLPLDSVHRSISRCDVLKEYAHIEVESVWAKLIWIELFLNVVAGTFKYFLNNCWSI